MLCLCDVSKNQQLEPKGRMSAELTGARCAEQGKRFLLLDSERVSVTGRVSRFLFFPYIFPVFSGTDSARIVTHGARSVKNKKT